MAANDGPSTLARTAFARRYRGALASFLILIAVGACLVLVKPTDNGEPEVSPNGVSVTSTDLRSGVVTGSLQVRSKGSQPLTYAIRTQPSSGHLEVDEAGGYSYRPTQVARLRAGAALTADDYDRFTVAVSDGVHDPALVYALVPIPPVKLAVEGKPIPVGGKPLDVAITGDGTRLTVLSSGSNTGAVVQIDTKTNTVVGRPVALGQGFPLRFGRTTNGNRIYVSYVDAGVVSIVDIDAGEVIGDRIPVGSGAFGNAVDPSGARDYVVSTNTGAVSVVDTATASVIGEPIAVGVTLYGAAVSPDGSRLYVIDRGKLAESGYGTGNLSVIDTATDRVVAGPIAVGRAPEDVDVSPDGRRAYVVNADDASVSDIDTATNSVVGGPIKVGLFPASVAFGPDGTVAYVTNSGDGTLSVVDTERGSVIANMTVVPSAPEGGLLYGVAVARDGQRIYVTDANAGTVSVVAITAATAG